MVLLPIVSCLKGIVTMTIRKLDGAGEGGNKGMELFVVALDPYVHASSIDVVTIMDYAPNDQAEVKVKLALRANCPRIRHVDTTTVGNYDTIQAGFEALCLLKQPRCMIPPHTIGYINVAPIYNAKQVGNGEHPFLCLLLDNGMVVFAPNAGHNIWYLLPHTVAILLLDFEGEDIPHPLGHEGQFRSWWLFTQSINRIMAGDLSKVESAWLRNPKTGNFAGGPGELALPSEPSSVFGGTDNFFNIRFTIHDGSEEVSTWVPGDAIEIVVDGLVVAGAIYKPKTSQAEGTICIRSGSNIIEVGTESIALLDGFIIQGSAHAAIGKIEPKDHVVTLRRAN